MFAAVLGTASGTAAAQQTDCTRGAFESYFSGSDVPASADPFEMSQNYPVELAPMGDYPWLDIDVADGAPVDPDAYIRTLLDYGLDGNLRDGASGPDWFVDPQSTEWFHIPWMHWGTNGREWMRGLTHEFDASSGELGQDQTIPQQTWAVSIINDRGAWGIGQVWCSPNDPQPRLLNPNGNEPNWFPNGSAQIKLLFTTAPNEQVPWLEDTYEVTADIFDPASYEPPNPSYPCPDKAAQCNESWDRAPGTVRLLQIDVAVRDDRLATGWAFGTFIYQQQDGDDPFEKLEPVGLMWGNDPGITPAMIDSGAYELKETWANPELLDVEGNHLGWGGRIAGPLDDSKSSCMSCHMTAGDPAAAPLARIVHTDDPLPQEEELNWFQNVPAGVPFSAEQEWSLDYSLQLSMGITRFHIANGNSDELTDEKFVVSRSPTQAIAGAAALAASAADGSGDDGGVSRLWFALWVVLAALAGTMLLPIVRSLRRPHHAN